MALLGLRSFQLRLWKKKKRDEIDSSETAMQTTVIAIPLATAIGPCVNKMHLRRGGGERKKERKKKGCHHTWWIDFNDCRFLWTFDNDVLSIS